ncbi:Serine/threonine-protein kinase PrkC [bacterium HR33]|nr:Serine/threonine-protein kinase PrkC [bacterium HR33]
MRLIDAGLSDEGRPYLVMEYVEGLPVDEYCDRRGLGIRERLELFRVICDAVQHAHDHLIVHRDLKPSNILVTGDGVPRLLDFGIAKLLASTLSEDSIPPTRTALRRLTPGYAAPEQIQGGPITPACDVHALGVLLYELLTGRHPFIQPGLDLEEVQRAVCHKPVPRPSGVVVKPVWKVDEGGRMSVSAEELAKRRGTSPKGLRRAISGDLDAVVLKACRKEPEWRYPSAGLLGEEIGRFLAGKPVAARADAAVYRTSKFLKRHAWAAVSLAVAFVALALMTAVTLVQSREVALQRDQMREVQGFLLETFGAVGPDQAVGEVVTASQLLDARAASLEQAYAGRPVLKAQMTGVLAEAYLRLGLYERAESLARRAVALSGSELGEDHPAFASALALLGLILYERGDAGAAQPILEQAVRIHRSAGRNYRVDLSRSLNDLGLVLERLSRYAEAERVYREALTIRASLLGDQHQSTGITASNLAAVLYRQGSYDEAVSAASRALRALRSSLGPDHQRSVIAQNNLAVMKIAAGQIEGAVAELRDLLERQRRLQGERHPVTAQVMNTLAGTLNRAGRYQEAEVLARRALEILGRALGPQHTAVGISSRVLGEALEGQGRHREAMEQYHAALAIQRSALSAQHPELAYLITKLGTLYQELGQVEEAVEYLREAVARNEAVYGSSSQRTLEVRLRLAMALAAEGAFQEAESLLASSRGDIAGEESTALARLRSRVESLLRERRAAAR